MASRSSVDTPMTSNPRTGMLARVRNRRGLITSVEPFDAGPEGRTHLVSVEYLDTDGPSLEDQLIWEREPGAYLVEPNSLPNVMGEPPMLPHEFDALVRATRWGAVSPYLDPDDAGPLDRMPVSSPFHAAIQVEDFQLVPLLKALRMPRVALLLADDVGLGKTVEAGLILTELLIRRRVRRVLIACPASLRLQWKQEMRDKFSLSFDVVDRDETHALQRRLGLDANPWRTYGHVITSYHYLKQPDVFEQFRAACRTPEGSPHLPWDLLIVDEAHNLAPAAFGDNSDLATMLRHLAPAFEHKLFLTATPHNGHTRCFTGLLESLDPVRFTQTGELTSGERERVEQVMVRRLKSEINAATDPPQFCDRAVEKIELALHPREQALSAAFQEFRQKIRRLVAGTRRGRQLAGSFALEVLGKRLLSCPATFAESWGRYMQGLEGDEAAGEADVRAARRALVEETGDDREAEGRAAHAAQTVGAWLQTWAEDLDEEMTEITRALERLGLTTDTNEITREPNCDARFEALSQWIGTFLRDSAGAWRDDERLVIFTEYKTTLDYLQLRLLTWGGAGDRAGGSATREAAADAANRIRVLFGGMSEAEREEIKAAFNDPTDPVRVLVATDAASEGLNLQETARYLLHYDIPWNPARLEQRNGRLDRHGQARDVRIFHFTSNDDLDLAFLAYVLRKVNDIREDLGSTGEVFATAFQRRFIAGDREDDVVRSLESGLEAARGRAEVPRAGSPELGEGEAGRLAALAAELDLEPTCLKDTLDVALGMDGRLGSPRLSGPDARGRFQLVPPFPAQWERLIDDTVRQGDADADRRAAARGALRGLLFDPQGFVMNIGGRPVFRPDPDTVLLHVGHPLFQRTLASFARARFPGTDGGASRWTVRRGWVPEGAAALVLLTLEELAVNELRETFHHWVHTITLPIVNGELGAPLPHLPALDLRMPGGLASGENETARDLWAEIDGDVKKLIVRQAARLTEGLGHALEVELAAEEARETALFQSRQGEVSRLIEEQTARRLDREIQQLRAELAQGLLFDDEGTVAKLERDVKEREEELRRRRQHYEELRVQLQRERERVLRQILPKRHTLRGAAQVFPVAVEFWLPNRVER